MSTAAALPPRGARSRGVSYQDLLDDDTHPVPEAFREESMPELRTRTVPVERYWTQEFHEIEVEKLWKKVWQMACREEQIPQTGDRVVYEIADLSVLIVRSAENEVRAFHNACLHRGRQLCESDGHAPAIRCPFHGWTWELDGQLRDVPCRWDFPELERERFRLPELKVGTWGGFVFVNPDPEAEPFEDHLGDFSRHFERWPLEQRYTEAHVAKHLPCNWKVAQEAFMEAYHVIATHPQLLQGIGDANSQYDVWDNFSRALTANGTPSPHVEWEPSEQDMLDIMVGRNIDEPPVMQVPEGMSSRAISAQAVRMQLQRVVPGVHELSDAELVDSIYYTLFPNFHPWGAYNRVCYRFRPYRNDANESVMEVLYLTPFRGKRPKPAPLHWLGLEEDWTQAPELGFLCRVFNQDTFNLGKVQRGLRARGTGEVQLGRYQEAKIRHFHDLLNRRLDA